MLPDSLAATLQTSLASQLENQFLSGGLVLMVVGAALAVLRHLPRRLWDLLLRRITVEVDVHTTDAAFEWLTVWLSQQPYTRRARRLSVRSHRVVDETGKPLITFSPAPGIHFFFYKGRLIWLHRERKEQNGQSSDAGGLIASALLGPQETYRVRVLGRTQSVVRQLLHEAYGLMVKESEQQGRLYVSAFGSWMPLGSVGKRSVESVVLPGGQAQRIVADVREFLDSREWYRDMGVPYRRGYLLHGLPGTGKTSLVAAIASEVGLNLYSLNLSSNGMTDDRLRDLFVQAQDRSIVLLEDIDAAVKGRTLTRQDDAEAKQGVTLSGLLNVLDGVASRDGAIIVMTTNCLDRMDPALRRPGRADYHLEFGYATQWQIQTLFQRFYPVAPTEAARAFASGLVDRPITMADVQQHLLAHKADYREALATSWRLGNRDGNLDRLARTHSDHLEVANGTA